MINLKEITNKIITKNNFHCLLIILIIFFLDRYSKIQVIQNFSDSIVYINEVLNFNLTWNTGIGFGLLSSSSALFYNLISGFIAAVIILLIIIGVNSDKVDKITFSLIIGGAFGNFYDRIVFNAVPDFIDFHLENFHWFTFNVADVFITFGIIIYIMKGFFTKKNA